MILSSGKEERLCTWQSKLLFLSPHGPLLPFSQTPIHHIGPYLSRVSSYSLTARLTASSSWLCLASCTCLVSLRKSSVCWFAKISNFLKASPGAVCCVITASRNSYTYWSNTHTHTERERESRAGWGTFYSIESINIQIRVCEHNRCSLEIFSTHSPLPFLH